MRRSCLDIASEQLKHPIEVDVSTKRVVIVTPSTDDHSDEDSKYFLVPGKKKKCLGEVRRTLGQLIDENMDIDELHNELTVLKDNI